jgi:hypothetical protein
VVRRDRVAVRSASARSSGCGEARTRFVACSLSRRQAEQNPVKGACEGCFGHLLPDADAASPIRTGLGNLDLE